MKQWGRNLAEAAAFSIVMVLIAWFDGSIDPSGTVRPLWFQVSVRFVIYLLVFFVVSLVVDAIFRHIQK